MIDIAQGPDRGADTAAAFVAEPTWAWPLQAERCLSDPAAERRRLQQADLQPRRQPGERLNQDRPFAHNIDDEQTGVCVLDRPLRQSLTGRSRPVGDIGRPDLAALKLPVEHPRSQAREASLRRAHVGGQHSGRLRPGARLETLRVHPWKPIVHATGLQSLAGRTAPRSTTNATAPEQTTLYRLVQQHAASFIAYRRQHRRRAQGVD